MPNAFCIKATATLDANQYGAFRVRAVTGDTFYEVQALGSWGIIVNVVVNGQATQLFSTQSWHPDGGRYSFIFESATSHAFRIRWKSSTSAYSTQWISTAHIMRVGAYYVSDGSFYSLQWLSRDATLEGLSGLMSPQTSRQNIFEMYARVQSSAATFYRIVFEAGDYGSYPVLFRFVNGNGSIIGSGVEFDNGLVPTVEMNGSTLRVIAGGTTVLSVTDTDIASAGAWSTTYQDMLASTVPMFTPYGGAAAKPPIYHLVQGGCL